MLPGALLLFAFVALATSGIVGRLQRAWLVLVLAGAATGLAAALSVLLGAADWEWRSDWVAGGHALHFRLDGVSALFLALLGVVGGAGAAYSGEYWSEEQHPGSARRGRSWWSVLLLSMALVLLCADGLHFLIAWEAFAIAGFFLITLDGRRPEVRAAGWLYLTASHAGTLVLFLLFASLASRTGSWDLGPMREKAELAPLFWLAIVGFGVKAGMFPLHVWLPSAHAGAPSHVSAILSGVALKMGVYGIVRFSGWLPVPRAAGWVVIALGATSALAGIAFALAQDDVKRLLAFCSVENVGIILVGLGAALLAVGERDAAWGRVALAGAFLHVWNHGLFKSLLFFGAGSVAHATGTRDMSRLGGLWRAMPWTAGLFALGAVAVSGLPPLNGFVSEWLVYLGLFDAAIGGGSSAWVAVLAALVMATAGALALASFVKAGTLIFLGAPRTQAAARAHESGPVMRGTMLGLAGACVVLGLAPILVWPAVARAMGSWRPGWSGDVPAPLAALGTVHVGLAALAVLAAASLWRTARANGLLRGPTWDCGYVAPTSRMQSTSGSMAGIAKGWFRIALRPEITLRRPRGHFPARALRLERIPEVVLERVVAPVGAAVMIVSSAVRRLQHGRLQSYILYVVAGLIAIGSLVVLENAR